MEIFNEILMIALRSFLSLLALFFISKMVGPKQISQLTFYDYIVGISIGSIAAMAVEENIPIYDIVISMIVFGVFTFILGKITDKSMPMRRFLTGKPSIVIYNGKIIKENLKKNNLDINDLLLNCRINGYFKIEEIQCAVFECNGQLSVMPYPASKPLTPKDMAVKVSSQDIEFNLIIDGTILKQNLKSYGKDENWLHQKLKEQGAKNEKCVLLAVGDNNDNLTVFFKNEKLPHNNFFM